MGHCVPTKRLLGRHSDPGYAIVDRRSLGRVVAKMAASYTWRWLLVCWMCCVAPTLSQTVERRPLNSRCPVGLHGRWWPELQQYVKDFVLFQPGMSERLATTAPDKFRQLVSEFAFRMADFCNDYLEGLQLGRGGINGTRPHKLTLDCKDPAYADIFSGEPRSSNATIVWQSHFSYEVPIAVYNFYTYQDLVDHFVFVESPYFQHSGIVKPLLFERIKQHFVPFLHKVEHMVVSAAANVANNVSQKGDSWDNERRERPLAQRLLRHRFKDTLKDDDIIIHGDMDETPDERFVLHLKQCQLKAAVSQPINSNIVWWLTDYRQWFKTTDASSGPGYPYSLMYPQVWTWGAARNTTALRAWRKKGQPFPKTVGGWHFNQPGFMPGRYLKDIGVSEVGPRRVFESPLYQDAAALKAALHAVEFAPAWKNGASNPDCIALKYPAYNNTIMQLPWLMVNNPEAFRDFIPCGPAFYDAPAASSHRPPSCMF